MKYMILFALGASALVAADSGVKYWSASELKGYEKKLSAKVDAQKIASEPFGKFGTSATAQISHREGPGIAEVHELVGDFFVVQSGEATLVTGGQVVSPKTSAPNEIRGASIEGGQKQKLSAGDIIYIPAKVPHQLLVEGKQFTYFVIKAK
jgi:mannose-6-phosphate isomerase-like protein (cupin superfamily)